MGIGFLRQRLTHCVADNSLQHFRNRAWGRRNIFEMCNRGRSHRMYREFGQIQLIVFECFSFELGMC